MAQLADLQFVGYRDVLEDIQKTLCSCASLKEVKQEMEPYGGLLGKIVDLENKIEFLKAKIDSLETNTYDMIHSVIAEHEAKCKFKHQSSSSVDNEFLTNLTQHELRNFVETIINNRLQQMKLHIY